jgi:hypothetical protein
MSDQRDSQSPRKGLKSNTATTLAVLFLALLSVLFTITLLGSFWGKKLF